MFAFPLQQHHHRTAESSTLQDVRASLLWQLDPNHVHAEEPTDTLQKSSYRAASDRVYPCTPVSTLTPQVSGTPFAETRSPQGSAYTPTPTVLVPVSSAVEEVALCPSSILPLARTSPFFLVTLSTSEHGSSRGGALLLFLCRA